MGVTIAEKILARKGDRNVAVPGDIVTVEVDTAILFDNNFMPANWREILKVRDPDRIVVVLDHRVPAPNALAAGAHTNTGRFCGLCSA
jgi:homoaconitase/3-isopropylmalate dehydratase large subunit